MATKDNRPANEPTLENKRALNRRDFVKTGVVAGLGSGALLESAEAQARIPANGTQQTVWHYEADVVIAGATRCAGSNA